MPNSFCRVCVGKISLYFDKSHKVSEFNMNGGTKILFVCFLMAISINKAMNAILVIDTLVTSFLYRIFIVKGWPSPSVNIVDPPNPKSITFYYVNGLNKFVETITQYGSPSWQLLQTLNKENSHTDNLIRV